MGAKELRAKGLAVYALLEQNAKWIDVNHEIHHLAEMDDRYLRNVLNFVRARARRWAFLHGLGSCDAFPSNEIDQQWVGDGLDELWEYQAIDPEGWIETTPLVRRIVELIGTDPEFGPSPEIRATQGVE